MKELPSRHDFPDGDYIRYWWNTVYDDGLGHMVESRDKIYGQLFKKNGTPVGKKFEYLGDRNE